MTRITLKHGREASVRRRHPWIFSGAVAQIDGAAREGDLVEVYSAAGEFVAAGHYGERDIAVRVLSYAPILDRAAFLRGALTAALELRRALGLIDNADTNACRLVNAEGDGLPGLVIDLYDRVAVLQTQSLGMTTMRGEIADALAQVMGARLSSIYWKPSGAEGRGSKEGGEYLWGTTPTVSAEEDAAPTGLIRENGLEFYCDWERGQKTGFYLDQRENRQLTRGWAAGRTVLNAFSYTGGFSVYALAGGAEQVCSIDASKEALTLTAKNIERNFPEARHTEIACDCFQYLEQLDQTFDLIILDPPAFVKHRKALQHGLKGYENINRRAIAQVAPGGFVFTFSCSQLVTRDLFLNTVQRAGAAAQRPVRVLAELRQSPCHPASLFHPEGEYLKGLLLYVS